MVAHVSSTEPLAHNAPGAERSIFYAEPSGVGFPADGFPTVLEEAAQAGGAK